METRPFSTLNFSREGTPFFIGPIKIVLLAQHTREASVCAIKKASTISHVWEELFYVIMLTEIVLVCIVVDTRTELRINTVPGLTVSIAGLFALFGLHVKQKTQLTLLMGCTAILAMPEL